MATLRLDQRRIDGLKPRKSSYDIRDRDLKGFGVRVLPSDTKRYFVHSQRRGQRVWKIVGDAGVVGAEEARARARTLVASIKQGKDAEAGAPADIPFETVADEVFRRYARNWKPSTLKVNRGYHRNHILPWFGGRPIGDITANDVRHWFASLHNTPVAADRSAPVLSVMGDPYLLSSIAMVVLGGTLITGGRGHYVGILGGAILFTGLGIMLSGTVLPEAVRNIIYGLVLLGAIVALRERADT